MIPRVLHLSVLAVCISGIVICTGCKHSKKPVALSQYKLNTVAEEILAHADKVEVFRLADFHEGENRTAAQQEAMLNQKYGTVRDYTLISKIVTKDSRFAKKVYVATRKLTANGFLASCFDPGVGFRAWHGKKKVELFVCFHCAGAELVTFDDAGKELTRERPDLGVAWRPFLELSREAFPEDKILQGIPLDPKAHK